MARVKLKRFKVQRPSPEVQARYLRQYNGRDLHFRLHELPPITARELFGIAAPLVLDLGCGRGEFLVGQAQQRPDEYFVGFDWHRKSIWDAANRAARAELDNVRFIKTDFRQALALVPDESVSEAFLLFPPPIMRYSKRKQDPLMESTLRGIHRVLQPGGLFHFVTDSAAYFGLKLTMIALTGLFEVQSTSQAFEGGQTRFQRFWEGFDIRSNRAECRKPE